MRSTSSWSVGLVAFGLGVAVVAGCSGEGGGGGGGGSSSSGGAACGTAEASQLAVVSSRAQGFAAGRTSVFVREPDGGALSASPLGIHTGAIVGVPKAGGSVTVVHAPATNAFVLGAFAAEGDDLFVVEVPAVPSGSGGADGRKGRLVRKNTASGAVDTLLTEGIAETVAQIVGVDASHVYLAQASKTAGKFGIYRVARAGGALETVTELTSTAFGNAQLEGAEVWFSAAQGAGGAYKVAKDAAGAEPTRVSAKTCLAGYLVRPDGVYCGTPLEVQKLDRDFGSPRRVLSVGDSALTKDGSGPSPLAATADDLYFSVGVVPAKRVPLYKVSHASLAPVPLVCGRGNITDLAVDDTSVYWIEARAEGAAAPTTVLFKAAR